MSYTDYPIVDDMIPFVSRMRCKFQNLMSDIGRKFEGHEARSFTDLDVNQACIQFIRFKDTLDVTLMGKGHRSLGDCTSPSDYLHLMLPGIVFRYEDSTASEAVDPEYVMGSPWRGHQFPKDPDEVIRKLNSAKKGDKDRAKYLKIGRLPLYVAQEGKNRVSLFRICKRDIEAEVCQANIESLPSICLDMSGTQHLITWKNEHGVAMFASIPYPTIALPIYRLLGAQIHSKRLPVPAKMATDSREASIYALTNAVGMP